MEVSIEISLCPFLAALFLDSPFLSFSVGDFCFMGKGFFPEEDAIDETPSQPPLQTFSSRSLSPRDSSWGFRTIFSTFPPQRYPRHFFFS